MTTERSRDSLIIRVLTHFERGEVDIEWRNDISMVAVIYIVSPHSSSPVRSSLAGW